MQYVTTDIISDLCFGEPLGFVKNQPGMHGFLNILETRLPVIEHFTVLTEFDHVKAEGAETKILISKCGQ